MFVGCTEEEIESFFCELSISYTSIIHHLMKLIRFKHRRIKSITKRSVKNKHFLQFVFNIADHIFFLALFLLIRGHFTLSKRTFLAFLVVRSARPIHIFTYILLLRRVRWFSLHLWHHLRIFLATSIGFSHTLCLLWSTLLILYNF
jgi:hypothetical protein